MLARDEGTMNGWQWWRTNEARKLQPPFRWIYTLAEHRALMASGYNSAKCYSAEF